MDVAATLARPEEYAGVWPENWPIVKAFFAVATQWRVAGGMGLVVLGLDYAGVRAGLDAAGIAVTPDLWAGLRIMEAEACAALNERG